MMEKEICLEDLQKMPLEAGEELRGPLGAVGGTSCCTLGDTEFSSDCILDNEGDSCWKEVGCERAAGEILTETVTGTGNSGRCSSMGDWTVSLFRNDGCCSAIRSAFGPVGILTGKRARGAVGMGFEIGMGETGVFAGVAGNMGGMKPNCGTATDDVSSAAGRTGGGSGDLSLGGLPGSERPDSRRPSLLE